jgi:hypothetical protein
MRNRLLWLALAAVAMMTLIFVGGGAAQPPGKKGAKGFPGKFGGPRAVTADQIVERILSFDKNNDGKVDSGELPERMQHLIALGDTNKDGALDKGEIRKLADTLETFAGLMVPAGFGGGPKGFGGFKGGALKGAGALKGGLEIRRTLDQLNLDSQTQEKANKIFLAYQDNLRKLEELARAELMLQMMDALSPDDYRTFKSALTQPRPGAALSLSSTTDFKQRIDQLQKDLEEIRGKLPK